MPPDASLGITSLTKRYVGSLDPGNESARVSKYDPEQDAYSDTDMPGHAFCVAFASEDPECNGHVLQHPSTMLVERDKLWDSRQTCPLADHFQWCLLLLRHGIVVILLSVRSNRDCLIGSGCEGCWSHDYLMLLSSSQLEILL